MLFGSLLSLLCFLQNRGNHHRRLEMETWHDLANVYTSLSQWRDAEVCLSKSKAIGCHSASRWHSTGIHKVKLAFIPCMWFLWKLCGSFLFFYVIPDAPSPISPWKLRISVNLLKLFCSFSSFKIKASIEWQSVFGRSKNVGPQISCLTWLSAKNIKSSQYHIKVYMSSSLYVIGEETGEITLDKLARKPY